MATAMQEQRGLAIAADSVSPGTRRDPPVLGRAPWEGPHQSPSPSERSWIFAFRRRTTQASIDSASPPSKTTARTRQSSRDVAQMFV